MRGGIYIKVVGLRDINDNQFRPGFAFFAVCIQDTMEFSTLSCRNRFPGKGNSRTTACQFDVQNRNGIFRPVDQFGRDFVKRRAGLSKIDDSRFCHKHRERRRLLRRNLTKRRLPREPTKTRAKTSNPKTGTRKLKFFMVVFLNPIRPCVTVASMHENRQW